MADVTVQELCKAALRKLRVIDPRKTVDSQDLADCFEEFKRMIRTWAIKFVVSTLDTHVLTNGTASYTIGSGGDIDTGLPLIINDSTWVLTGGLHYPLTIIGEKQYSVVSREQTGADTPTFLWYKPGASLGTIYLHPAGAGTLYLWSKKHLTDPSSVSQNTGFDENMQDAIVWNLSCRMAPEYIGDPTPYMLNQAVKTYQDLVSKNEANDPAESDIELSSFNRMTAYDIDAG